MSLLTVVQTAYQRLALQPVPSAVFGSSDPQVAHMMALANEEGQTLGEVTNWEALTKEATFTTVATEVQGPLSTIAPGCKFIVNDTIWNRTLRMPVFGPLSAQGWQQQKAMYLQGPWNQFRVVNDQIKFLPIPAVGQSCYFEYTSKFWTNSGATTYQSDTDFSLLDEDVMVMGLIWRFKEGKGIDFQADLTKYQRRIADMVGRETPKPILSMDANAYDIPPIVILPAGSWGV